PSEQIAVGRGKGGRRRSDLGPFAGGMIRVAFAEEATTPFGSLEKYSIAAGIRRAIGYAVLHHMNINAGAQRMLNAFPLRAINDFLHGEISLVGVLPVKQCRGDPDLVRDLDFRGSGGRCGHSKTSFLVSLHLIPCNKEYLNCQ